MSESENHAGASVSPQITRDYNIVRLLGKGGMGEVYLAEQLRVGRRPVALKVLNRSCCDDPDLKRRFENEAASAGRIHHRNVVMVYECRATDDGQLYVAMEYVQGRDLGHVIEERGTLSIEETVQIIKQAAAGLSAAHKLGIVHRDVKPANIMLTEDEDGSVLVKVLDFGIARLSEADSSGSQTKTGVVMGTPHFMSPEQTLGQTGGKIDHRSDIYSLAMVAYQMLTGRVAFESDSWVQVMLKHVNEAPQAPSQVRPDLAHLGPIDQVIFKGLEKDREKRQQSATQFANELEAAWIGMKSGSPSEFDTLQYSGRVPDLPFASPTSLQPGGKATSPNAVADETHAPTVMATPTQPAGGAGQMGAVDTSGSAKQAGSFETVAMSQPRPTAVPPGPGQAVEVSVNGGVPAPRKSSAGRAISAVVSAVILLGLAGAAYTVLRGRGGATTGQSASNVGVAGSPMAASSPSSSVPAVAAPTASPSSVASPESNANKAKASEKEGREDKKDTAVGSKPIGEETPMPERNPHELAPVPSPTPVVRATPQPSVQSTPTRSEEGGDESGNCIGVLVLGSLGNPVRGASVTLVDQTAGSRFESRTGAKGRARFCDLVVGHRYSVTAVGPRGMMSGQAQRYLTPGRNPVQIQLQ